MSITERNTRRERRLRAASIRRNSCLVVALLVSFGCASFDQAKQGADEQPPYTRVHFASDVELRSAEFSGLAWFVDDDARSHLALLEQSAVDAPGSRFEAGRIRLVSESVLRDALTNVAPIAADKIRFMSIDASRLPACPGWEFDGYEAVAFDGKTIWIAAEFEPEKGAVSMGVLCMGRIEVVGGELVARLTHRSKPLVGQARVENMAYESIVFGEGRDPALIYEANGALKELRMTAPTIWSYARLDEPPRSAKFPHIEYRITDATAVRGGRFWATNYFFPGDDELAPAGHGDSGPVERLVEFRISDGRIEKTGTTIALRDDASKAPARNWEGVAWSEALAGFLVVTDANDESHGQETILGFISSAANR